MCPMSVGDERWYSVVRSTYYFMRVSRLPTRSPLLSVTSFLSHNMSTYQLKQPGLFRQAKMNIVPQGVDL